VNALELENAATRHFADRYDIIAQYPFVAERPVLLYDHDPKDRDSRRCRFCGKGRPEATFKKVAHAAPEFLGNKAIRSMNECDSCNEFLAGNYEDHLSKWSLFARAVSQVKGKEGTPTFKNPGKTLRVESGETGLNIHLTDPSLKGRVLQEGGPQQFTIPADGMSAPYVPIRAAKALVKIACSVCPPGDLAQCKRAIDWLMGRCGFEISQFLVFYGFTPGPISNSASRVILLRRKADTAEPYLWSVVQSTGHRFQIFVPGCPADDKLFGSGRVTFPAHHYRIPEFGPDWPYGETKYGRLDWSGTEPVQTSASATFHVEYAVRQSDGGSKASH
jgi:hypothetical protein